jgi:hypothetical protein
MRRLGWVILLCVSVDFSNPLLPGTVRFDPSESVEAVHGGTAAPSSAPSPRLARQPDRPAVLQRLWILPHGSIRVTALGPRWFLAVRPVRHQPDDQTPALSPEDH